MFVILLFVMASYLRVTSDIGLNAEKELTTTNIYLCGFFVLTMIKITLFFKVIKTNWGYRSKLKERKSITRRSAFILYLGGGYFSEIS